MKKLLQTFLVLSTVGVFTSYGVDFVCVNGDKLLKESEYAQKLKKEVEKKREKFTENFQEKARQLVKRIRELQNELSSGMLNDEAKREKQKELIKLQQELQMLQITIQQELRKYITSQLKKLDTLTKSALKALAKVKGFKVASDCNALLYYDPSVDITDEVAKVLDQLAEEAKVENK
ncbi:MAG TPA: OmpH family outer membrane protein [Aquifex sp.]|nr:OmpH family outer membrane protein [Aquifex sp.]